jgi:hypothetical protein
VANKTDLQPVVPLPDLEKWCIARKYPLFRTSAKDYLTVAPIFERVAEDLANSGKPTNLAQPSFPENATENSGCC